MLRSPCSLGALPLACGDGSPVYRTTHCVVLPLARAGFTVTKKIGNSVVRNRLKRRLRALVRQVLPEAGITGADHVLIGRDAGLTRDFAALDADLRKALAKCSGAK